MLSQVELATAVGVAPSTLSRCESGAKQPSLRLLDRVLAACGKDLELTVVPRHADLDRTFAALAALAALAARAVAAGPALLLPRPAVRPAGPAVGRGAVGRAAARDPGRAGRRGAARVRRRRGAGRALRGDAQGVRPGAGGRALVRHRPAPGPAALTGGVAVVPADARHHGAAPRPRRSGPAGRRRGQHGLGSTPGRPGRGAAPGGRRAAGPARAVAAVAGSALTGRRRPAPAEAAGACRRAMTGGAHPRQRRHPAAADSPA
jgi:transcriptional regulator with XRE-family HTH domain